MLLLSRPRIVSMPAVGIAVIRRFMSGGCCAGQVFGCEYQRVFNADAWLYGEQTGLGWRWGGFDHGDSMT